MYTEGETLGFSNVGPSVRNACKQSNEIASYVVDKLTEKYTRCPIPLLGYNNPQPPKLKCSLRGPVSMEVHRAGGAEPPHKFVQYWMFCVILNLCSNSDVHGPA